MPFKFEFEVGRLCMINYGPLYGQLVTIVDIIDKNRMVIDGPTPEGGFLYRQEWSAKQLHLTPFVTPGMKRGVKETALLKALNASDTIGKWKRSRHGKRLARRTARAELNDFERYIASHTKTLQKRVLEQHNTKVAKGLVAGANLTNHLHAYPLKMQQKIKAAMVKQKSPMKHKTIRLVKKVKALKDKMKAKWTKYRERRNELRKKGFPEFEIQPMASPAPEKATLLDGTPSTLQWNGAYIEQFSPGVFALAFLVLAFLIMKQVRRFQRKLQNPLVHV
eukprot:gnl/MRDRNA2_/MRDRNA2_92587_c0_seq1.p1 gnl/MRDRNA2_/MRDRNA2_92587_c0~~gnl/MRDRNA2_/MRDRNA2_92587_c0_seq1.p1  ORF type:complete len:278 (-),score=48.51 gnl/MRDRNA2_/MRDRNA2_92587_c0_seq1:103-936(-)